MELFVAVFGHFRMNQFRLRDLVWQSRRIAAHGPTMNHQDRTRVQINHVHAGAICAEIGERLQAALKVNTTRLPPHLARLTELLDRAERRERLQDFH